MCMASLSLLLLLLLLLLIIVCYYYYYYYYTVSVLCSLMMCSFKTDCTEMKHISFVPIILVLRRVLSILLSISIEWM